MTDLLWCDHFLNVYHVYATFQIICSTVVAGLSILLGGSALVCLSRGSWVENAQTPEGNSSFNNEDDPVTDVEPETQALFEPNTQSGDCNRGMSLIT